MSVFSGKQNVLRLSRDDSGRDLAERGQRQYTFAMRMQKEDTLQEDACFDRLIFEHTEDFCRDVCELMTGLKKF